jgi:hypothetical protein
MDVCAHFGETSGNKMPSDFWLSALRTEFDVRFLPCNWVVKGFCGVDGRLCELDEVVG